MPNSCIHLPFPPKQRVPRTTPATPFPGTVSKSRTSGIGAPCNLFRMALAKGCSERLSNAPAVRSSSSSESTPGNTSVTSGFPVVRVPSFVQNNRIHPVQIFQCLSIFEENPHLGAPAGSNHDGDRCGQAQSTGAGNHQNRNSAGQAEFQTLPRIIQTTNVTAAMPMTTGTKTPAIRSANRAMALWSRQPPQPSGSPEPGWCPALPFPPGIPGTPLY